MKMPGSFLPAILLIAMMSSPVAAQDESWAPLAFSGDNVIFVLGGPETRAGTREISLAVVPSEDSLGFDEEIGYFLNFYAVNCAGRTSRHHTVHVFGKDGNIVPDKAWTSRTKPSRLMAAPWILQSASSASPTHRQLHVVSIRAAWWRRQTHCVMPLAGESDPAGLHEEGATMSARSLSALLGISAVAALVFSLEAQAQQLAVNGWNLYRAQDPDGRLQFSLGYMDPIERRFTLTFGCSAHSDEVTIVYYPPAGTPADEQNHEVRLVSEKNSDTFYGPYRDVEGQVLIFGLDGKSSEQVGLLRSGFAVRVDDVHGARLYTMPEQAADVEELIAGCWP